MPRPDICPARHDLMTRLLHWLLALLLVAVFVAGLWLADLGLFDSRQALVGMWHKSLGVLTGLLMLVRLLWRWRQPALPPVGTLVEQGMARFVRVMLYVLVLLAVLSGYLLATGSGRGLEWFGLLHVPALLVLDQAVLEQVKGLHVGTVWGLAGLTLLHLLAVLKHQLLERNNILRRML